MLTKNFDKFAVTFTDEERAELLRILEATLVETHAEKRRTEAPDYQQEMARQEAIIRTLIDKVRRSHP